MIAYISGHLDLTFEEYAEHYRPQILEAHSRGDSFVVGDAHGCDAMAQAELIHLTDEVTIYHMFTHPRVNYFGENTEGGFSSDSKRDAAMTAASDYDIAWVRPGRENSGTARNLARRAKMQRY